MPKFESDIFRFFGSLMETGQMLPIDGETLDDKKAGKHYSFRETEVKSLSLSGFTTLPLPKGAVRCPLALPLLPYLV